MPGPVLNDAYASYAEARLWAVWLQAFEPRDLAQSMLISEELAAQFCVALVRNGTCRVEAEYENGRGRAERIYGFVPLPPGPTVHPTRTPVERSQEECPGVYELAPRRGVPVPGMAAGQSRRARLGKRGSRVGQARPGRSGGAKQRSDFEGP